jgi:hypothetical protein
MLKKNLSGQLYEDSQKGISSDSSATRGEFVGTVSKK